MSRKEPIRLRKRLPNAKTSKHYLLWAFVAIGCTTTPTDDSPNLSRIKERLILGTDDSRIVDADGFNVPEPLSPVLDAVGRMEGIACTGTHIGNGLVLTAAHCVIAESPEQCRSTSIEWGVRDGLPQGEQGRCLRVIFSELSESRDIALFEVDAAPRAKLVANPCRGVGPGDSVVMFGHPERAVLHWSTLCVLEALSDATLGTGRIGHVCDTDHGSSGGPLLDATTFEVVAVHDGGAGNANQATLLYKSSDLFEKAGFECSCSQQ